MRRVGSWPVLALALAVGALVAGCGSAEPPASTPTTADAGAPTTEPTEIVPDSAVTAGLAEVRAHAAEVATAQQAGDTDGAKAHAKQMYESWYRFEATVRKNEKDLYLQMEDGLADIQAGARDNRADRIERGTKDLGEGATAYLGKHP